MEFFGLIGEKLGHSLSETIHARVYELLHIPAAYKCMEIERDRLSEIHQAMTLLSIRGINVTIPYKEAVIPYLDELDSLARAIGAVNTVKNESDRLTGYNTDVYGLMGLIRFHGLSAKGQSAVVLGSGGAAKAAIHALCALEARDITVVTRSPQGKTCPDPRVRFAGYDELPTLQGALLLNATPVGMWPHCDEAPAAGEDVERFASVVDMIYNPWETKLLAMAGKQNKPCANGLYMLVAQAVRAEEIFFDRDIPDPITEAIYHELSRELNR